MLAGINSKIMTEKHVLDQDKSICIPHNDNKKLMIEDYKKWRALIKNAISKNMIYFKFKKYYFIWQF